MKLLALVVLFMSVTSYAEENKTYTYICSISKEKISLTGESKATHRVLTCERVKK